MTQPNDPKHFDDEEPQLDAEVVRDLDLPAGEQGAIAGGLLASTDDKPPCNSINVCGGTTACGSFPCQAHR
jgi:hypothetical protein